MGKEYDKIKYSDTIEKCIDLGRKLRKNPHGHAADYLFSDTYESKVCGVGQYVYYSRHYSYYKRNVVSSEMSQLDLLCGILDGLYTIDDTAIPDSMKFTLGKVCSDIVKTSLDKGLIPHDRPPKYSGGVINVLDQLSALSTINLIAFKEAKEGENIPSDFLMRLADSYARGVKKSSMSENNANYKLAFEDILADIKFSDLYSSNETVNKFKAAEMLSKYNKNLSSSLSEYYTDFAHRDIRDGIIMEQF